MPDTTASMALPPEDGGLGWRAWLLLLLGAAILLTATYLTEPGVFTSIDWLRIHVYYKEYLATALRHGRLPLWNPHVMLGRPFLADVDAVIFYPPTVAYLFFEVRTACALGIGFHLVLGLYGTLRLARALDIDAAASWAVAFVFVASAPIVGSFSAGLINYGAALCYIPLLCHLALRVQAQRSLRRVALLALVLGFQILAGHPQATWLAVFGAGLLLVGRRLRRPLLPALRATALDLVALAASVIAAAAMAAVVLLPLGELAGQSNRQAPSLAFASSFAMRWPGWLTFAVPNDPRVPVMPNAQTYAGVVAFLLAPCALARWRQPNARSLLLGFVGAALLAAGNATPVFSLFYHLIPGLAHFRIPARASVLMTLAMVLAAGITWSARPTRRSFVLLATAGCGAMILVLANAHFLATQGGPVGQLLAYSVTVWQGGLVVGATLLLVLWLRRERLRSPRTATAIASLLALLTLVDIGLADRKLCHENRERLTDVAEDRLAKALVAKRLLSPAVPPPRLTTPAFFKENSGMRHGWSQPRGYTSFALARVWHYIYARLGLPVPTTQVVYPAGEILERGPFAYDSMALVVGVERQTQRWVVRDAPDPRAYLVSAGEKVRDFREATVRMRAGHPFHQIALVERPLPAELTTKGNDAFTGQATITHFAPEHITIRVKSSRPALLVLAEPWYPGWTATVNGLPTTCFAANAWMRATLVPAGDSQVVLDYRSTYLPLGAVLSLATFVLLCWLCLRPRRGRATSQTEPHPDSPHRP